MKPDFCLTELVLRRYFEVASLGNLAALQTVGSLNDLMHAGALEEEEESMMEEDAEARAAERSAANSSWADLSLLVISGGGS